MEVGMDICKLPKSYCSFVFQRGVGSGIGRIGARGISTEEGTDQGGGGAGLPIISASHCRCRTGTYFLFAWDGEILHFPFFQVLLEDADSDDFRLNDIMQGLCLSCLVCHSLFLTHHIFYKIPRSFNMTSEEVRIISVSYLAGYDHCFKLQVMLWWMSPCRTTGVGFKFHFVS